MLKARRPLSQLEKRREKNFYNAFSVLPMRLGKMEEKRKKRKKKKKERKREREREPRAGLSLTD